MYASSSALLPCPPLSTMETPAVQVNLGSTSRGSLPSTLPFELLKSMCAIAPSVGPLYRPNAAPPFLPRLLCCAPDPLDPTFLFPLLCEEIPDPSLTIATYSRCSMFPWRVLYLSKPGEIIPCSEPLTERNMTRHVHHSVPRLTCWNCLKQNKGLCSRNLQGIS